MERDKIKRLYGMGAALGLVGHGADDAFHELVRAETGKEHISDLTDGEYKKVVARLAEQMPKRKRDATAPGMMTQEQINRFFAYFYQGQE